MSDTRPFALFITGPHDLIFELSDALGFDSHMEALAISLFERNGGQMELQALYATEAEAETALKSLSLPLDNETVITQLPNEDWVAKSQAGLPPVFAGRFCVFGAHSVDDLPNDMPVPIRIEAGAAFGTGHHGTTKGCLLLFDDLLKDGIVPEHILDLGTGAGTLAIAAAKVLDRPVLATDIDSDAVTVTQENAAINDVSDLITAETAYGFDSPILRGHTFDLIFANILAGPLMGLAPDIAKHLTPNGYVILSGILDEQAEKVKSTFEDQGLTIKKGPSLSGWTSLLGSKPSV